MAFSLYSSQLVLSRSAGTGWNVANTTRRHCHTHDRVGGVATRPPIHPPLLIGGGAAYSLSATLSAGHAQDQWQTLPVV
jgi:hypothetical protein